MTKSESGEASVAAGHTGINGRRDVAADVQAMWDVLAGGGVVICPGSVGYTMAASSKEAVARMNAAKGRGAHKRLGLMMGDKGERQVHELDASKREIIDCVTKDYDLPLVVIAKYRPDHRLIRQLDDDILKLCTANGTVSAGVNMGGWFLNAINQLEVEDLRPILASSANRSGRGVKASVDEIEPEVVAAADLVIDYGPVRHHSSVASTQINFETMELVRWGVCFDSIAWVLHRHFGIELPPDPGRDVAPGGHVNEFALADAE
jgi:tRNA A37 threonylcarbamoyladenosine synthetase subunit TsaC/SUA5/YrdC